MDINKLGEHLFDQEDAIDQQLVELGYDEMDPTTHTPEVEALLAALSKVDDQRNALDRARTLLKQAARELEEVGLKLTVVSNG